MNPDTNIYLNSTPEKYNILIDIENIDNFLNIRKLQNKQNEQNDNDIEKLNNLEDDNQKKSMKNGTSCSGNNDLESDKIKNVSDNDNNNKEISTINNQNQKNKDDNLNVSENNLPKMKINNTDNDLITEKNETMTESSNIELESKELSSEQMENKDTIVSINSYSDIDLLINKYTEKFDARKKIHEVRSVENRQSFFESGRKVVEDGNIRIKNYQEGHDNINDNIQKGPLRRRMSTIKLKTFYDRDENIINITEDNYIKKKAEDIFGESLRSSNNKSYEYEFISNGYKLGYLNVNELPIIEDETEVDTESKTELKPSMPITETNINSYDENIQDLNQLIIDEYYDEYQLEKDKLLDQSNLLENIEFSKEKIIEDDGK
ncbi:hypothetical protein PIROE2DRAFT_2796 [Piromyces sp. E2]|nr:hypothetical protein PIROE2DRAFT_2796 [Piromyces sp. E2]|eukprot:OUM69294.1 hypothetical protein PIROE2DRAFT_2796 [Piromyces sp. E2]